MNIIGQTTQIAPTFISVVSTAVITCLATVAGVKALTTQFPGIDIFFSSKKTKKERNVQCNFCPENEKLLTQNASNLKIITGDIDEVKDNFEVISTHLANSSRIIEEIAEIQKESTSSLNQLVMNAKVEERAQQKFEQKMRKGD